MTPRTPQTPIVKRMSSDERREQILDGALAVFGSKGYVGSTTDDVAKAAAVSQPYVVRLFGSKENLFLAAMERALDELMRAFRAALADTDDERPVSRRLGDSYVGLLRVRGLHQTLSHCFLLGGHPVIGPAARRGFADVWRFLREEAGFDADTARVFLAEGMLITTMIGLRLVDDYAEDPSVTELFLSCFPTDLTEVLERAPRGDAPW
ncbi:TetR/AcrR family transcriptional regulator [Microbacterium sp. P05]|uniref:TetR/AcrR family transcriptional regulator n=1 Tax=Microbacterium sp. P05 TaxID=3366948 RepID=UPI0037476E50